MPPKKKKKMTVGLLTTNCSKFTTGEKVWCMWKSRYYEAKILGSILQFDGDQYYDIHYYKFSKKWDMPVNEKRLLSFTKENIKLAKKTNKEFSLAQKKEKLYAKLKQEILEKVAETSLQEQSPFLKLTDFKHTVKSFDIGHVSVSESVSSQTPELTEFVICDNDKLKNMPTKSCQTIKHMIKETDRDTNVGLSFSSEDSINDFGNFFNTVKTECNFAESNQQNNQEDKIEKFSIGEDLNEIDNSEYGYIADDTVISSDIHECLDDSEQQVIASFIEDMNSKQYNNREINDSFTLNNINISNNEDDIIGSPITTSKEMDNQNEEELLLRNEDNFINSDDTVDNQSREINNLDVEVATTQKKLVLNDKENIGLVNDNLSYEASNTSSVKESNPPETTNIIITAVVSHSDNILDGKNNKDETSNFSEEVTTSKLKEHLIRLDDQHKFINSVDFNSEPSCCSINHQIFTFCNKGACRISSVSIVTEMPSLEKNLDNINDNNSSGSASLIVTTALLNNDNKLGDIEKNFEVSGTSEIKNSNPQRNVSLIVTTTALSNNENNLNNEGKNGINNENSKNQQNSNVSIKMENTAVEFIIPEDNFADCHNSKNIKGSTPTKLINKKKIENYKGKINVKKGKTHKEHKNSIDNIDNLSKIENNQLLIESSSSTNETIGNNNIIDTECEITEGTNHVHVAKVHKKHEKKMGNNVMSSSDIFGDPGINFALNNSSACENIHCGVTPCLPTSTTVTSNEKNINCYEDEDDDYDHIETSKVHEKKKHKNNNISKDIYVDEDDIIFSKHQQDPISNKNSIKQLKNSFIIPSLPTSTAMISNKRQINYSEGEDTVDDHIEKKTKIKKYTKKISNDIDVYAEMDNFVFDNYQHDLTSDNSSTLNKIYHSISKSPSSSTTTLTNNKIEMTKDHLKKKNVHKKHKKKGKNIDIHVNQINGFDHASFDYLNESSHSMIPSTSTIVTNNQRTIIDYETSTEDNDDSLNHIKMSEQSLSSSSSSSNKMKIDDFGDETTDGDNHVKNIGIHKKYKEILSTDVDFDEDHFQLDLEHNDNKVHSKIVTSSTSEAITINNKKCHDHKDETTDEDDHVRKSKVLKKHQKQKSKDMDVNSGIHNQISRQTSNDNCSYSSSSLSIPLLSRQLQSDEDIDGQTTEDDDQYVKNRKVSKKKLTSCDIDHNIYELFAYEKPYSRAAKVKANEAISQMSKPPLGKEKKNDAGKRSKNGKKKDDEDPGYGNLTLLDYDLDVPMYIKRILTEDKHLIEDDRFIPILPAKLTVYQILFDYAAKFPVCRETLDMVLDAFNMSLSFWLLHPLEKPKNQDLLKKYPDRPMCKIYGLPHLLRFIMKLPKLFYMLRSNNSNDFIPHMVHFMRGLFIYLVDEDFQINISDYDPVMPDYYRMAYFSI